MSKYGMLDIVINDILQAVTPTKEDWALRFWIVNDLRTVVESLESLRGAIVEPFGSFVSNLFTPWGDLDISIELSNGSYISSAGKKHKQVLLGDFLKALRMKGGWNNLQLISNARVPILKFRSHPHGVSCDISINNLEGQMKSKILLWISEIDGRFHDMVLLVKEWAKAHKINNSKAGTFNSYSLSLLVIFHFQTCVPAIFPPLKDIYPRNMVDDLTGVRADAEKLIAETCRDNITQFISDKSRPKNRKPLPELFVEFLRKFAQIDSWASELGISTYTGKWEQIRTNMRWLPKTYAIFVEDPFGQPQNTARSVSTGQLDRIAKAFLETYSILISKSSTQSSILTYLAPPHVSRVITQSVFPNYAGNYYHPAQPPVQRANHPTQPRVQRANHPDQPKVPRASHPNQPKVVRASHPNQPNPNQPKVVRANHPIQPAVKEATRPKPPQHRGIQNGGNVSSSNGSTSSGPVQAHQNQQIRKPRFRSPYQCSNNAMQNFG